MGSCSHGRVLLLALCLFALLPITHAHQQRHFKSKTPSTENANELCKDSGLTCQTGYALTTDTSTRCTDWPSCIQGPDFTTADGGNNKCCKAKIRAGSNLPVADAEVANAKLSAEIDTMATKFNCATAVSELRHRRVAVSGNATARRPSIPFARFAAGATYRVL